jgi:hypothetical protein
MDRTFVPSRPHLVTFVWIDHFSRPIGPKPFITTKTVDVIRGRRGTTNAQFVVTKVRSDVMRRACRGPLVSLR